MEIILLVSKTSFILRAGMWKSLGRPPSGTQGGLLQRLVNAEQSGSTLAVLQLSASLLL